VIQGRDGAGFSLEAREAIGIASHFRRKDFERYGAAELGVHGAIDFAHAAGADGSGDFVMGKRAADQGAPPGCRRTAVGALLLSECWGDSTPRGSFGKGDWRKMRNLTGENFLTV
jgi:hypothetical protein